MINHTTRRKYSLPLKLNELIHSEEFKVTHRCSETDFIRERLLTFPRIILMLLGLPQKSYASELRTTFETLDGTNINTPTNVAFSKARKKIKQSAFIGLNDYLFDISQLQIEKHRVTYKRYILIGIDGSTLQLPDTKELREHFDPKRLPTDIPQARISECFDVGSDLRIDAIIAPIATSEREMLVQHLKKLPPNALVVMDRGYAAHWVFQLLLEMDMKFCIRTSVTFNASVKNFLNSEKKDAVIKIPATVISKAPLKEAGITPKSVYVRAVRIELSSGETEVLITNLDANEVTAEELKEVYWQRWGSETAYKTEKQNYAVENFSGKTKESIYQDYHANIFVMNLTAIIALPAHEVIEEVTMSRKKQYTLNWRNAARLMREKAVALLGVAQKAADTLRDIFRNFGEDLNIVRPGRQFRRFKKRSTRKYHMTLKSL